MTCREFENDLEALLSGTLGDDGHARCVGHAAACVPCRELVEPMGAQLAEVDAEPPRYLLAGVLARTSLAPRRTPVAEIWRRWMLRPRFASEAAYVGVVVLSLVAIRVPPRAVLDDLRAEAGILLDRATSLLEKENP